MKNCDIYFGFEKADADVIYPIRFYTGYNRDHWDIDRGFSHATGYEVKLSDALGDTWCEFVDSETGETFLAR